MYFSTLHKCPIFSAQILQFSYCNRPDFPRQLAHLKLWQPAHLKRILNVPEIFSTFCPSLRHCACTNINRYYGHFCHCTRHWKYFCGFSTFVCLCTRCSIWGRNWSAVIGLPTLVMAAQEKSFLATELAPFFLFKRFNIILYCQSWLKNWMFEIKKQISTFIIKLFMYMYTCAFLKWKKECN